MKGIILCLPTQNKGGGIEVISVLTKCSDVQLLSLKSCTIFNEFKIKQ